MEPKTEKWSVWIDEDKKIISTKKIETGKEIKFEHREQGIEVVNKLVVKGFKVG